MKPALIDVSVLLIFFNRPYLFRHVFEQIKIARPSRLFLYQDGPRNDNDIKGIEECRKIALDIDWECEVHTKFQEKNVGCDPSEYLADTWAFSLTDKCIILEDDCVPSQSFFQFCKEMLDRYEHDDRVWMISGFNHEEISHWTKDDYFFTDTMCISGWATWKRVIDSWDSKYSFLDNPEKIEYLKKLIKEKKTRKDFIEFCKSHRDSGREHYETILWSSMLLNNGVAVMPRKNLINNIGTVPDSTHTTSPAKMLPRAVRKVFTMNRHELSFPLVHPLTIEPSQHYHKVFFKSNGWGYPLTKVGRSFEELFLNLRYGNFSNIGKSIASRFKKIFKF